MPRLNDFSSYKPDNRRWGKQTQYKFQRYGNLSYSDRLFLYMKQKDVNRMENFVNIKYQPKIAKDARLIQQAQKDRFINAGYFLNNAKPTLFSRIKDFFKSLG